MKLETIKNDKIILKTYWDCCYNGNEELECLGQGRESYVFKINDDTAVKVYKEHPENPIIEKDLIEELSSLDTRRIITPTGKALLKEDGQTAGYLMELVEDDEYVEITDLRKKVLLDSLNDLKKDIKSLGKKRIRIDDLRLENLLVNPSGFYLVDCGSYEKESEDTTLSNIEMINYFMINEVMFCDFLDMPKTAIGMEELNKIRWKLLDEEMYIGDYLEDTMYEDEDLKTFAKRKKGIYY